jgi:small subunit ribosomal protein S1
MAENEHEGRGREENFADLLEAYPMTPEVDFRPGDVVEGTVVKITQEHVFVDLGAKSEGIADSAEFLDEGGRCTVAEGDRVELKVISTTDGITLSKVLKARGQEARHLLRDAFESALPVEGRVTGVNKGGFEIDISGQRAFCPISQIDLGFCDRPEGHVGARYTFKIVEFKEKGKNIIVSRRALLEEERQRAAQETMAVLRPGLELEGRVTRLTDFGAFVDIGGVEGLVHVSEIAHQRVSRPSDVLQVGQSVRVVVTQVEATSKDRAKIGLSIKALLPTAWEKGLEFREGEIVRGKVTRLADFGAFVEIAPGLEGLVHISEISYERIHHPRKVLEQGQEVEVRILAIDYERRRVSLSIKEALAMRAAGPADKRGPTATAEAVTLETLEPGAVLKGVVEKAVGRGLIVRLPEVGAGVKGFLSQEDAGLAERADMRKRFPQGTAVTVEVVDIDAGGRIRLSLRTLEERREQELYHNYKEKGRGSARVATFGDLFKDLKLPVGK